MTTKPNPIGTGVTYFLGGCDLELYIALWPVDGDKNRMWLIDESGTKYKIAKRPDEKKFPRMRENGKQLTEHKFTEIIAKAFVRHREAAKAG